MVSMELGRWSQGRRIVTFVGILLVADLCLLPWHHFALHIDLGQVGLQNVPGVEIDRAAVRSPNGYLGIGAVMLTVLLIVLAVAGKVGSGPGLAVKRSRPGR